MIIYRACYFYTTGLVPCHNIGRRYIYLGVFSLAENIYTRMFKKTSYDTCYGNIFCLSFYTGTKTTYTSDNQMDFYAFLRGFG